MRKTAQKKNEFTGALVNSRKTHRNDECPCGRGKVVTYRRPNGEVFKEERVRNKFKNCCMDERGEQAGTVKSTEQQLKDRRSHVGWPMRDYLNTPIHKRQDTYERGGFFPRSRSANNNKKTSRGRPVKHRPVSVLLGTSIMIAVGSTKGCIDAGTVKYELHADPKSGTQVTNRLQFIPFYYKKGGGTITEQIAAHRKHAKSILKDHQEDHGWRVSTLEKWEHSTRRVTLDKL